MSKINQLSEFQKNLIAKQEDVAKRMRNECEVKPEATIWEQVRNLYYEYEKEKGNTKYKEECNTIRGMLFVNFVSGKSGYEVLSRDSFESMTTLEALMNIFRYFIDKIKEQ